MRTAFILLALLCACPALVRAAWNTNAWPASSHPKEAKHQSADCWTAVYERATAVLDAPPAAPTWYKSERANIIELKTTIREMLQPTLGATFTPWISGWTYSNAQGILSTGAVLCGLHETNVMLAAGVPTNFFDYTPRKRLWGSGTPYTNEFGWDGLKAVVRELQWATRLKCSGAWATPIVYTNTWTQNNLDYGGKTNCVFCSSWGDLASRVLSEGSPDAPVSTGDGSCWNLNWMERTSGYDFDPPAGQKTNLVYYRYMQAAQSWLYYYPTNRGGTLTQYVKMSDSGGVAGHTIDHYATMGDDVYAGTGTAIVHRTISLGSTNAIWWIGPPTNHPPDPGELWAGAPQCDGSDGHALVGWASEPFPNVAIEFTTDWSKP